MRLRANRPVTLRDVAREAHVSVSAVSYVLNDSPHASRISEPTKARIWEVAQRLGYRVDPIGRALQRGYTNQVTLLIVSWNLATSHAATAMAISRAAGRHGLQLTVHVADEDQAAESFLRRSMLHKQGGILVLWDSPAMQASFVTQLAAEGIPVVDLLPDGPPGVSVVTPDREDAFFRGTRHLIELGHRRIALVCDPIARQKTTLRKLAGYRRALAEAGLNGDDNWIANVREFGFEGGYEGYQNLYRRCPEITGVLCINDAMALGVVAAAGEHGRSCPTHVSVIGFGDSAVGNYFPPRLTTFALSSDRVAEEALGMVVRQRDKPGQPPQTILIPEELIVRESTAPAFIPQVEQPPAPAETLGKKS